MTSELPADFLAQAHALEDSYLAHDDPIRQSGFGGGAERWRAERGIILEAIHGDGALLDIGCANGYLLECLVAWGAERGLALEPHGIDIGPRLVAAAKERLPEFADNFQVANGWDYAPLRRFRYVYTLSDCVPEPLLGEYVARLLERAVEPAGRLIVGAYGSSSRREPARAVADELSRLGYTVSGRATAGGLPLTEVAWLDHN